MRKINIRESLLNMDRETNCQYDLTSLYEACKLDDKKKSELVKYIDAYDFDATNRFLSNEAASQGLMENTSDDMIDEDFSKYAIDEDVETFDFNDEGDEATLDEKYVNGKWEPEFGPEWKEEDIALWKSIDWKARNYERYVDETDTFEGEVVAYSADEDPKYATVTFAKELSANPIYSPAYKPTSNPFEGTVGFMYDGTKHNGYMVMDRTETQEVYDMMFENLNEAAGDIFDKTKRIAKGLGQGIKNSFTKKDDGTRPIDNVVRQAVTQGKKDFKSATDSAKDTFNKHIVDTAMSGKQPQTNPDNQRVKVNGKSVLARDVKYVKQEKDGKTTIINNSRYNNLTPQEKAKYTAALQEDILDDSDYEPGVEAGKDFFEDGKDFAWMKRHGDVYHLDFDNWAVWEAFCHDDGEMYFFVVDEDSEFVDWGPVDTVEEAQEFLQSKVNDWENDDLDESKSIKEGIYDYDVFTQHCIEFYCDSGAADDEADMNCPDNPDDWNIGDPRFVQRAVEYYKQSEYYDPEDWELDESKLIKEGIQPADEWYLKINPKDIEGAEELKGLFIDDVIKDKGNLDKYGFSDRLKGILDKEFERYSPMITESRPDKDIKTTTNKVTIKYGNSVKEVETCKPIKVTEKQLDSYRDNYSIVNVLNESKSVKDKWCIEYNNGATERHPMPNKTKIVEGTWEDVLKELDSIYVDIPGEYDDDDNVTCSLEQFIDKYEGNADLSGSTVVLKITKNGEVVYKINDYERWGSKDNLDESKSIREDTETSIEWEHTDKDGRKGRIRQLDNEGNPKSLTRDEAEEIAKFRGHEDDELNPVNEYFEDDDFSDEELASIYGGDTKYDMPDGIETPEETEARLAAEKVELNEATDDSMIYLFPELTDEDVEMAKAYGLQFIGYNHGPDGEENNWVMRGTEASLNRFADKYLGYELHPDYLYYEDDFAGDIAAV